MGTKKFVSTIKAIFFTLIIPFIYGCVQTMSKGSLRTQQDATLNATNTPIQEAAGKNWDFLNVSSLLVIILIVCLLLWKKGVCCRTGSEKK